MCEEKIYKPGQILKILTAMNNATIHCLNGDVITRKIDKGDLLVFIRKTNEFDSKIYNRNINVCLYIKHNIVFYISNFFIE